jgi:radical SAM-linked protein
MTPEGLSLGHRDIVDGWIEAVSAAGGKIAMSEGKRPSPQVSLGAPLPQGVTSDCEFIDVFLAEPADPSAILAGVSGRLPQGIEAVSVVETGVGGRSLQALLRWAEYQATVPRQGLGKEGVQAKIAGLLLAREVAVEHQKENRVKRYDLRPMVLDVRLACADEESFVLLLRLRAEPEATARADDTIAALGLPAATHIHRASLHLAEIPAALAAYRRYGEPENV